MKNKLIIVCFAFILTSCLGQTKNSYRGELSQPNEAMIMVDNSVVDRFNENNSIILKRYLAGNSRWEIRQERGKTYAIRKEKENNVYETTLNGYYSNFESSSEIYQTRVIISFGNYFGHGRSTNHITYSNPSDKSIKTIIEAEHSGTPGNSSYVILEGNSINIEIYEQSKKLEREFTIQSLQELNTELKMVLENLDEIEKTGISPKKNFYPILPDSNYFEIEDGMQPGIYIVKAGLSTNTKGIVYVKVFNSATNERLSADRMTPRTTRELGWSEDGKSIFPYESELTVYEGDWSHKYKARFEIWFRPSKGAEIKLTEKERIINGWER